MGGWENDILAGIELGYVETQTVKNVTDLAEGTGTPLLTLPPIRFDGDPVLLEAYGLVGLPTSAIGDVLIGTIWEAGAEVGRIFTMRAGFITSPDVRTVNGQWRFSPAAGVHTYYLAAYVSSTTGTPGLLGGPSGVGGRPPFALRITKV